MRVLIIHDEIGADARADESDLHDEVELVLSSLRAAGHEAAVLPVGLDLSPLDRALREGADCVFNLMESLGRSARLIDVGPALVEVRGIPCTGCSAESIAVTSNKPLAKRILEAGGIDTPPCRTPAQLRVGSPLEPGPWIVKSRWEHASVGLDEDCVFHAPTPASLAKAIEKRFGASGGGGFAEGYVDGREFNVGLLEGPGGVRVLPIAEIAFEDYAPGKPRVVGFRAKWEPESFEYAHTIRRFDLPEADSELLRRLSEVSLRCWRAFELRGYARVDFRVDAAGRPWVLEVNANPCISRDAGFMMAAGRAGLSPEDVIDTILGAALSAPAPAPAPSLVPSRRSAGPPGGLTLREEARESDEEAIRGMAIDTGFFRPDEVEIAAELVRDRITRGVESDYRFLFVDDGKGRLVGYTCYGEIACTLGSYDLYWIVVAPTQQGRGLGRLLLRETESRIRALGGRRVYIETSSLPKYAPTQHFYRGCGYDLESRQVDFYQPGDDKLVYVRSIEPGNP